MDPVSVKISSYALSRGSLNGIIGLTVGGICLCEDIGMKGVSKALLKVSECLAGVEESACMIGD